MSEQVEKRVVEMQFDNAKFEKNVNQSMKTIDKLDEKLQFKNVSESLQKVKVSFSAFEVAAVTMIVNITNRIVNLGIQLVKSLSIDNISVGWSKFGQKTIAVATMAAQKIRIAGKELTNYSDKLEAINEQLEKLNWFTDETSYNFTDMADNIGKFTAAGRDLDESVNAMMGIATWAALSGQNATTASSAMFQLAQALGRGYIMTMDWRSIENARMSTEEFKQTVLDTAVAMGQMTKEGEKYITKTGDKISVTDFDLSSKWFTSDILLKSLEKYSAAVERIYEISNETGLTATEVMARYSDELDEFGLKAFRAAQEARTLADTINAIKDAVSTGWMNTAEKIFGGYDESKILFTELANQLYDVFAEGGNFRNEILGLWNDLEGRNDIFGEHGTPEQGAFWNIYDSIIAVKKIIKETWNSIFSLSTFTSYSDQVTDLAEKFKSITSSIKTFTKKIKDAIENSFELKAIFAGLFSIVKVGVQIIYGLAYALDPIVQVIKNIISLLFNRIAAFGMQLTKVDGIINSIQVVSKKISEILSDIIDFIDPVGVLDKFLKFISKIYQTIADTHPLEKAATAVKSFIDAFRGGSSNNIFTKIAAGLSGILDAVGSKIGSSGKNLLEPLHAMIAGLLSFMKGIIAIVKPLITIAGQALNFIGVILETVGNILSDIIKVFNGEEMTKTLQFLLVVVSILGPIAVVMLIIYNLFYSIYSILKPFQYLLSNISDAIYAIGQSFYVKAIANIIKSLGFLLISLAISMSIIANIPTDTFRRSVITLSVLAAVLTAMIIALFIIAKAGMKLKDIWSQFANLLTIANIIGVLKSFAFILIGMGLALKLISSIGSASMIWNSVMVVAAILGALTLFIYALTNIVKTDIDYTRASKLFRSITWTLLLMSIALKTIASIESLSKILNSVVAIGAILLEFSYFIAILTKVINNDIDYNRVAKTFKSISWTLLVMGLTIKLLSSIKDTGKVWGSVAVITSILLAFLGFVIALDYVSKSSPNNYTPIINVMYGIDLALIAIAMAMKHISSIGDTGLIWSSVGAITAILMAFLGFVFILNKLASTGFAIFGMLFVINGMAVALVAIGLALSIAAKAMKNFNDVEWDSFGKLAVAFLVIRNLGKAGAIKTAKIIGFSLSLISLSVALLLLGSALKNFSDVDWNVFKKLTVAFLVIKNLGKAGIIKTAKITIFAVALIILSTGLLILASALKRLSDVDWNVFGKLAVVFLVLGMVGLIGITSTLGILMISGALVILSSGLSVLAIALGLFNNVSWDSVFKGLVSLIGTVGLLVITMKLLKNNIAGMMLIGVALIILAGAIAVFAVALSMLASVSWETLGKGITVIAGGLLLLGLAATLFDPVSMGVLAIVLTILGASMIVFSVALQMLSAISWKTIGKGAAIIAGGLLLLGVAAAILKPIIVTILMLSAAILMLGLGMLTASVALGIFATNLPLFLESIIGNVTLIAEALATIGPVLVTAIVDAFVLLLNSLGELIPSIVNLVTELINGIISIILNSYGGIVQVVVGLITVLLQAFLDNAPQIFSTIFKIIFELLKALSDNIEDIAQKLIEILLKIIKVVTKNLPTIMKALLKFLIELINVLFDNIGPLIDTTVKRLFEFLGKVIDLFIKELLKFTGLLVTAMLVLIANVIKLLIISLGTLGKLFIDLIGGIILIIVHTFIGLGNVLYQAFRTILYNMFYVLFEILRNLPDDLLNLLGGALGALLGSIVKMIGGLINKYFDGLFGLGDLLYGAGENMINSASNGLSNAILKGTNVLDAMKTARGNIGNVMGSITDMISDDVNEGVGAITTVMQDGLAALAGSAGNGAQEVGEEIGNGISEGVNRDLEKAYDAGKTTGDEVIEGYRKATGTKSPSKVMEKMGKYFVDGLTNGIYNNSRKAKDSVFSMMNDVLSGVESVLGSDMENEFTIRPVMDLSGVASGAANISSLMNNINGGSIGVTGQMTSNLSKKINKGSGSTENQNSYINNKEGDVYNATFNVVSDNPEEIANEVNIRLQKMHIQAKQAKGGVR